MTAVIVNARAVRVGDRIVVTPRLADQFGLEVTQVIARDAGVHVEGYRCAVVSPYTRTGPTLVWRYLSDLALIERVAVTEPEDNLQAALGRVLS